MSADQGSGKADQGSEGSTGEGMQFSIGAQVSCSDEVFGELAARAVGSRSSYEIECARTDRLAVWAAQTQSRRPTRRLLPARRRSVSLHGRPIDALGTDAVRAISEHTDQTRAAALALVDELLAIGAPERECASDAPTERAATEQRPLTRAADRSARPAVAPADASSGTP